MENPRDQCLVDTKDWHENWSVITRLESGAQGDAYLVSRKTDPTSKYFLKALKKKLYKKSRERLSKEALSYQQLNHIGIPKLVETNANSTSPSVYLVTEYIDGIHLQGAYQKKKPTINEVIGCLLGICGILNEVHALGVVHRDIKPKNIMLRGEDWSSPFLVDFGLSVWKNNVSSQLTDIDEEVGNRFLHLPELKAKSELKNDPRSDVTLCVGILFYLLTGEIPVQLSDQNGTRPHQREEARKRLLMLKDAIDISKLMGLFDQAFSPKIDDRFQKISELELQVRGLMKSMGQEESDDVASLSNKILGKLNTPEQYSLLGSMHVLKAAMAIITRSWKSVCRTISPHFISLQSGYKEDGQNIQNFLGFSSSVKKQKILNKYRVSEVGNEIVIYTNGDELYRFSNHIDSLSASTKVIEEKIQKDLFIAIDNALNESHDFPAGLDHATLEHLISKILEVHATRFPKTEHLVVDFFHGDKIGVEVNVFQLNDGYLLKLKEAGYITYEIKKTFVNGANTGGQEYWYIP